MRSFFSLLTLSLAALVVGVPQGTDRPGGAVCSQGRRAADQRCCIWFDVLDDAQANLFKGATCRNAAHESLRLMFHDSIGFSNSLTASGVFGGGGSDGSIIEHSDIELTFPPNGKFEDIVEAQRALAIKHGVSFADIIQFAAAVGTANCPGAPRLEFMAGRANTSIASPPGLVPGPANSVDRILTRMADAGFSADDTVDLLASHSIATQEDLNHDIPNTPFDTTPDVFDTQFFVETLLKGTLNIGPTTGFGEVLSPIPGEFRMQSDFALARDPRTACRWQSTIQDGELMSRRFRDAMVRLAVLGNDRSKLVDCSAVIPVPKRNTKSAFLPGGKTAADIEGSCATTPFPVLPIAPGPLPSVAPVIG